MKSRRGIISALMVICISLLTYGFVGIKEPLQEMDTANLTIQAAPDQTKAMEHPSFTKETYLSILPEGENIAGDGKINASSFADVYTPRKAVDGNVNGGSYWEAAADSYPNILTINLKEAAPVNGIRIRLCPINLWGKRTQTFAVNVSLDGESYKQLIPIEEYTFDPGRGNEAILQFDTLEVQYVQLEFTGNSGAGGAQVAEFEIYSK